MLAIAVDSVLEIGRAQIRHGECIFVEGLLLTTQEQ